MALKLAPAIQRSPGRATRGARLVAGVAVCAALLAVAFGLGRASAPAAPVAAAAPGGTAADGAASADGGQAPDGVEAPDGGAPAGAAPGAAQPAPASGPASVRNDVPVGYARSEDGAIAAATGYLSAIGDKRAFNRSWRETAYRTMADPATADELLESVAASYERIDGDLGLGDAAAYDGSILAVTVPVGYRVDDYAQDRASITVWAAGWLTRLSGPQLPLRAQSSTMELTWVESDWKLTAVTGIEPLDPPGVAAPVTDEAFSQMRGFNAYEYHPQGAG